MKTILITFIFWGFLLPFGIVTTSDVQAATNQQLADQFAKEIKRYYRVSLNKQNVINARWNDPIFHNNDPSLQTLYFTFNLMVNQTTEAIKNVHDRVGEWATKHSITWPTGALLTAARAKLRTMYASNNELSAACVATGFTDELFAQKTSKYETFYIVVNWFVTDVLRFQGRLQWYINQSEANYPDTVAEELTPIFDKMFAELSQARYYVEAMIQADVSRRAITGIDNLEIGDAVYGKKMSPLQGGLYLLNNGVSCTDPVPNANPKKAEILTDLVELL